jgi:hypothetical protein
MDKYAILQIEGGIGKNVMATAVVRAIQKKYPERKIVIISAYPDIWLNNQRIHKTLQFGQISYFYREYIENKDSLVFLQEPYRHNDYVYRKKHLTEIWCELCDVPWDGETPELYFTQLESDFVNTLINKDKQIFIINAFGGSVGQQHKYSWARDIPPVLAQEIVDEMSKNYRVIQIRRDDQIMLNNADSYNLNIRQTALMLILSDRRLLIDSFLQHASVAFGLTSTVLWSCNTPKVFGYNIHKNIISNFEPGDLRNSMYEPYDILGDPAQIITSPGIMFDKELIIKSLDVVKYVPPVEENPSL